jgi:hypothetical protein
MSNDLTEPQGGEKYDTTPGVTAILERINQVHADLLGRIDQRHTDLVERINQVHTNLSERINQVRTDLLEKMNQNDSALLDLIGEVRADMLTRFNDIEGQVRLTNARLDVDREDLFNTKVQVRDVRARIEELERKRS